MSSTDTNQASELYELCKEVYKRTGWNDSRLLDFRTIRMYESEELETTVTEYGLVPLYNSDYLLEKLPPTVKNSFDGDDDYLILYKKSKRWYADYMGQFMRCESDTALKALLKLTIALSEAGELK